MNFCFLIYRTRDIFEKLYLLYLCLIYEIQYKKQDYILMPMTLMEKRKKKKSRAKIKRKSLFYDTFQNNIKKIYFHNNKDIFNIGFIL